MELIGHRLLDVDPVETGGAEAGFKDDDGRSRGAFFDQVETAAAANVDKAAGGEQALTVDERADPLIDEAAEEQQRDQCRGRAENDEDGRGDPENDNHGPEWLPVDWVAGWD